MSVFAERSNFALPTGVAVDATQPGTYDAPADLQPTTIPAGTVVNSYFVHADQVGTTGSQRIDATITFPNPIVGVIISGTNLTKSTDVLGATGTDYRSGGPYELPGSCPSTPAQDCVILVDARTLTLKVTNYNVTDQVRVLTRGQQYAVCPLYDQTKSHKLGSTVPIKLRLCDSSGANLSSDSIVVNATGLTKTDNTASAVEDAGSANSPDNNFRYDASLGGYIYNLSTKPLSTGTWTLTFTVNGDAQAGYTVSFDVK